MRQTMSDDRKKHSLIAPYDSVPQFLTTCPRCGGEIELWSEDDETVCIFCEHRLFEREKTNH